MSVRINFWRQGHANNSSSDHNLAWTRKARDTQDHNDGDFGWDFFTCASRESKALYIAICLYNSYRSCTGIEEYGGIIPQEDVRDFIMSNFRLWMAGRFPALNEMVGGWFHGDGSKIPYVDHQSVLAFPCHRDKGRHINVRFAQEFITELVDGDYLILGGNDNTDEAHPLLGLDEKEHNLLGNVYSLMRGSVPQSILCEKDDKIGDYVISSSSRGDIMRVSFVRPETTEAHDAVRHAVESVEGGAA